MLIRRFIFSAALLVLSCNSLANKNYSLSLSVIRGDEQIDKFFVFLDDLSRDNTVESKHIIENNNSVEYTWLLTSKLNNDSYSAKMDLSLLTKEDGSNWSGVSGRWFYNGNINTENTFNLPNIKITAALSETRPFIVRFKTFDSVIVMASSPEEVVTQLKGERTNGSESVFDLTGKNRVLFRLSNVDNEITSIEAK